MFGIIRPCKHRLSGKLQTAWMAHLCGLCLALRDEHGQAARVATNYDGLIISVLVEAQSDDVSAAGRRKAGPCPLRGMRRAEVSTGEGAKLAAAVSLVLASTKMRDHVEDGDGLYARRPVAGGARRIAGRWARQAEGSGRGMGFDTTRLTAAVERQGALETAAGPGVSVLTVTEPTETATAAAFAHTAVLAGRPENEEPLAEAGRLFGRLAHLLDAVEDVHEDRRTGAWNPLTATETGPDEAYRLCRDAATGIRLALREVGFRNGALAHRLLVHEVDEAIRRSFRHAGIPVETPGTCGTRGHGGTCATHRPEPDPVPGVPGTPGPVAGGAVTAFAGPGSSVEASWPTPPNQAPPGHPGPYGPYGPPGPYGPGGPGHDPNGPGGPWGPPGGPPPPRRHNVFAACAIWAGICCTCQACCREEFTDPCSGQQRQGCCHKCDCCEPCGNCCDCCNCCSSSGEGDGGCDCGCDCGC